MGKMYMTPSSSAKRVEEIRARAKSTGKGFVAIDGATWEEHYSKDTLYLLSLLAQREQEIIDLKEMFNISDNERSKDISRLIQEITDLKAEIERLGHLIPHPAAAQQIVELNLEISDLKQALTGRTVSCESCNRQAGLISSLTQALEKNVQFLKEQVEWNKKAKGTRWNPAYLEAGLKETQAALTSARQAEK